jgi:hypothetical protein
MAAGAVRHGSMALEGNYVDSHGQSAIGFAITPPARLRSARAESSRSTRSSSTSPIAATPGLKPAR